MILIKWNKRTILDWAESSGWTDLVYSEKESVWRGFRPGSYIEEEVPIDKIKELIPCAEWWEFEEANWNYMNARIHFARILEEAGIDRNRTDLFLNPEWCNLHQPFVCAMMLAASVREASIRRIHLHLAQEAGVV
jgi:hypothetical protein